MQNGIETQIPFSTDVINGIRQALEEDIGSGDVTTNSILPSRAKMLLPFSVVLTQ